MNKFPNVNLNELDSYVEYNKKRMCSNNNSVYKKNDNKDLRQHLQQQQ